MSTIEERLRNASEEAEERRHELLPDPLPNDVSATRRTGDAAPKLLTVRLSADQHARLAAAAAERDLPVSTLARTLLMEALDGGTSSAVEAALVHALKENLRPDLLRSA
ncbi:hypothetical protein [Brevibacterium litoralis]|uniref:hypothetical protein n=1 Tax=Brevibacterium litoralis TaxID=3138935 RepID=UPI0032ECDE62